MEIRKQLKAAGTLSAVMAIAILLVSTFPAFADSFVPDFLYFSGCSEEEAEFADNGETCTLTCETDGETLNTYKALLPDCGLIPCAMLTLPASDGSNGVEAFFYSLTEQEKMADQFVIRTAQGEIPCHLLLQDVCYSDEKHLVSLTWSSGLPRTKIENPARKQTMKVHFEETETPCFVCSKKPGACPMCGGDGTVTDYGIGWKDNPDQVKTCGVCDGTGLCKACDGTGFIKTTQIVTDPDEGE